MNDFVAVGKISGAVGLKGEIKIVRWSDSPERFSSLNSVWIGRDSQDAKEFIVERARVAGTNTVLKLGGIETRSAAEEMRGRLMLVPGGQTIQPAEGSYFIDDVLGMNVVTEEGKRVGIVCDILRLPSNDLWQVESGSGMISIPAVKEFIRTVNVRKREIVIHEIEGLLDV